MSHQLSCNASETKIKRTNGISEDSKTLELIRNQALNLIGPAASFLVVILHTHSKSKKLTTSNQQSTNSQQGHLKKAVEVLKNVSRVAPFIVNGVIPQGSSSSVRNTLFPSSIKVGSQNLPFGGLENDTPPKTWL